MANKNSKGRRNAVMVSAAMVLVLLLVLALVIGVIVTLVGSPAGTSSDASDISNPSSEIISSDISSQEPSSEAPSSDISSETPSVNVSSQTPSTSTSSTVSQAPIVPTKKVVYLTFDDGPSKNTPKLLDTLDELGVKATFFVVGNAVRAYPQNLTEIVNRGHKIALHADQHTYAVIYKSEEAYFADLQKISDLVYQWTGIRSNIIRFPGGSSNKVSISHCPGIMTKLTKSVQEKGYYYFDWNVDSGDADGRTIPAETLIANVKKYAPQNVNLLMHDTADKYTTIEALPEIVKYYKDLGYEFDVLDETSPAFHHKVNN